MTFHRNVGVRERTKCGEVIVQPRNPKAKSCRAGASIQGDLAQDFLSQVLTPLARFVLALTGQLGWIRPLNDGIPNRSGGGRGVLRLCEYGAPGN